MSIADCSPLISPLAGKSLHSVIFPSESFCMRDNDDAVILINEDAYSYDGLASVRTSVYSTTRETYHHADNSHQVEWSGEVSVIVHFQGKNKKNTIHQEWFPECQEASFYGKPNPDELQDSWRQECLEYLISSSVMSADLCQEAWSWRTSGLLKIRMSGIPDLLFCDVCRIPEDKSVWNTWSPPLWCLPDPEDKNVRNTWSPPLWCLPDSWRLECQEYLISSSVMSAGFLWSLHQPISFMDAIIDWAQTFPQFILLRCQV